MNNFSLPSVNNQCSLYIKTWLNSFLTESHEKAKVNNYCKKKSTEKWKIKLFGVNKNYNSQNITNFRNNVITSYLEDETNYYMIQLVHLISTLNNKNKLYLIKDAKNYSLAIITVQCENLFLKYTHETLTLSTILESKRECLDISNYIISLDAGFLSFYSLENLSTDLEINTKHSIFTLSTNKKDTLVWPIFTIDEMSIANIEFIDEDMDKITRESTAIKKYYNFSNKSVWSNNISLNNLDIYDSIIKFNNSKL
ncbi:hypothetical protein ACO0SA_001740 [Hanseniaspora valbyensis]